MSDKIEQENYLFTIQYKNITSELIRFRVILYDIW